MYLDKHDGMTDHRLRGAAVGRSNLPVALMKFQSVFSRLSPLRLGQLCIQNIHNYFQENIPEDVNPICPTMPEIKIDLNGVLKRLRLYARRSCR